MLLHEEFPLLQELERAQRTLLDKLVRLAKDEWEFRRPGAKIWLDRLHTQLAGENTLVRARIQLLRPDYDNLNAKITELWVQMTMLSGKIRGETDERVMEGYIGELHALSKQHMCARSELKLLESPPGSPFENGKSALIHHKCLTEPALEPNRTAVPPFQLPAGEVGGGTQPSYACEESERDAKGCYSEDSSSEGEE